MTVLASRRHHQMLTELGAAHVIDNREEPEAVSAVSQVKYRITYQRSSGTSPWCRWTWCWTRPAWVWRPLTATCPCPRCCGGAAAACPSPAPCSPTPTGWSLLHLNCPPPGVHGQAGLGAGRRDEPGHPPRPQHGARLRAGQEVGLLQTGPPRPGGARPPGEHRAAEARGLPHLQLRSVTRGLRQEGR